MVLLVYLNFFLQLLGLSHSHDLPPMGEDFHAVEVSHFLLFIHGILENVSAHLHLLLFLIQVFHRLVLMSNPDHCSLGFCG